MDPMWWAWLTGAYLAGSVPFALLLGWTRGIDIRKRGSGNVGASNVGRVLGRGYGLTCFALDLGKGLGPVLGYGLATGKAGGELGGASGAAAWLGIAAAAVAGHVFPVWLRLRGGKGVATGLGAVLGVYPVLTGAGLAAAALWGALVWWTGYVSVGSMSAAAALPVLAVALGVAAGLGGGEIAVLAGGMALIAAVVIARHRGNLARLRTGTEARAGWARRPTRPPDSGA